jgi:hypothetical protein
MFGGAGGGLWGSLGELQSFHIPLICLIHVCTLLELDVEGSDEIILWWRQSCKMFSVLDYGKPGAEQHPHCLRDVTFQARDGSECPETMSMRRQKRALASRLVSPLFEQWRTVYGFSSRSPTQPRQAGNATAPSARLLPRQTQLHFFPTLHHHHHIHFCLTILQHRPQSP